MKRPAKVSDPVQLLCTAALQYPETHEGLACEGTIRTCSPLAPQEEMPDLIRHGGQVTVTNFPTLPCFWRILLRSERATSSWAN